MKTLSIIGLGLIGGSIAKGVKNSAGSDNIIISAYDYPEILQKAMKQKVIDKKLSSIEEGGNADIVILSLPTDLSLAAFEKLSPLVRSNTVITDVCSVKGVFEQRWAEELKNRSSGLYIGGHPMTGKEKGGFDNSDPLLFENSVYILSDKEKNNPMLSGLLEIISLLGARIKFLDPHLHDKIIAGVSHLPQLVAVSLVNSIPENGEINYIDFAAGGFRDMTRIASSDFGVWLPIIKNNINEIEYSIDNFIRELYEIKKMMEEKKYDLLGEKFSSAGKKRDSVPKNTKGFLNPLSDLFIYVKDEPGVLYKLTGLLYKESINIKDLELLKVREGKGGTFRVSFDDELTKERARLVLVNAGYRVDY